MSGKWQEKWTELGDGYRSPTIKFRLKHQDGDLWFSLWAWEAKAPIFSGMVSKEWPNQLRTLADEIEAQIEENNYDL